MKCIIKANVLHPEKIGLSEVGCGQWKMCKKTDNNSEYGETSATTLCLLCFSDYNFYVVLAMAQANFPQIL